MIDEKPCAVVLFSNFCVILADLGADHLGKLGILEKCVIWNYLRKHLQHGQISVKWSNSPQDNSNCKICVKERKKIFFSSFFLFFSFFFVLLNTSSVYHAVQTMWSPGPDFCQHCLLFAVGPHQQQPLPPSRWKLGWNIEILAESCHSYCS